MMTKPPFERVVTEHGPTVLRVCRALLEPADADDAWSETFLAALRAYPQLPEGANHQAWLVTIAHRKAVDVIRARLRRPVPAAELDGAHLRGSHRGPAGPDPEGPGPDGPGREDLQDAVGRLSLRQRQAVVYHHLGGLPYAEVAALIGGTPEAARRAAADGIARLRRELRPQPGEIR